MRLAALLVVAFATNAHADASKDLAKLFERIIAFDPPDGTRTPKLTFTNEHLIMDASDFGFLLIPSDVPHGTADRPIVGTTSDAAWIATDVKLGRCPVATDDDTGDASYYRAETCKWQQKGAYFRGVMVFAKDGAAWQPVT